MEKKAVDKKFNKTPRRPSTSSRGSAKKVGLRPITRRVTKKTVAKKSSDILAVIKTGGKQYKVREGQELLVERLKNPSPKNLGKGLRSRQGDDIARPSDKAVFEEVLLFASGDSVKVGTPLVSGAKVEAKVLGEEKGKKVIVFKMKAKKRYRKKTGHRQKYTKVVIEKISA